MFFENVPVIKFQNNDVDTSYIGSAFFSYHIRKGNNIYKKYLNNFWATDKRKIQLLIDTFTSKGYKTIALPTGAIAIYCEDVLIVFWTSDPRSGSLVDGTIYSTQNNFEEMVNVFCENLDKSEQHHVKLKWYFLSENNKIEYMESIVEEKNPPFTEMYPFLNDETLHDYYERYQNSSASILLLQGPPGTGKTTFIRGLLQHTKKNALLTYDDALLRSDNFLQLFLKDKDVNYLIFEDADAYLTARESGNKMIHKFLNAGDGLISVPNKKIIFTTNLQSVVDIDSALTRPGRCFDILQFRNLTKHEAIKVAQIQGGDIELQEKDYTIAEIFNTQTNTKKKVAKTIGFDL